jgi:hypothetical protein
MIKSPQAYLAKMVQGYRQGVSVAAGRVHLRSQLGARGGAFLRWRHSEAGPCTSLTAVNGGDE